MVGFMTNAKNTNTLPSVAVWHELGDFSYQDVQAHVADFRGIEDSLGLPHIPISINEYASPGQVDQPSIGVHYMAAFERAGIHDAERAYWYEAGTMDGLLYDDQPTASYWPTSGTATSRATSSRPCRSPTSTASPRTTPAASR